MGINISGAGLPYATLDVFTKQAFAGNPLAVVFEADGLPDATMLQIAREFGYSETTFVLKPRNAAADWRLRSFTTAVEVYGAGHNALGAWWALAATGRIRLSDGTNTFRQELGDDVLPVEIASLQHAPVNVFMQQKKAIFGEPLEDLELLGGAFGLPPKAFEVAGLRATPVSTGARHLLVPVADLSALRAVTVHPEALAELTKKMDCGGCYLFTRQTLETSSTAHARFFTPAMGTREDPATGSAAGPLGAYLQRAGRLADHTEIVVEQGDQVGRPSRIHVRLEGGVVRVGGPSVVVTQGNLLASARQE